MIPRAPFAGLVALFALCSRSLADQTPLRYTAEDIKVPVVLGVMSQCPDAILCESVFDKVLQKVGDKIDLSLTFLGT